MSRMLERTDARSFYGYTSFLRFLLLCNFVCLVVLFFLYMPPQTLKQPSLWFSVFAYAACWQSALLLAGSLFYPLPRGVGRPLLVFLHGMSLILVVIDLVLFLNLRIHLDDPMTLVLLHPKGMQDIGFSWLYGAFLVGLFLFVFLVQWLLGRIWWRWFRPPLQVSMRRQGWVWGWTGAFVLAGGIGYAWTPKRLAESLTERLPGYQTFNPRLALHPGQVLRKKKLVDRAKALRYPRKAFSLAAAKHVKKPLPHILLIASESVRADMLNPQDMPQMYRFLQKHPHLSSSAHYSTGHQTWEGMFGLMYGLAGHQRPTFYGQPLTPHNLLMLKQLGYRLLSFSASSFKEQGYEPLVKIFDQHYDIQIFKQSFEAYNSAMLSSDLRITEMAIQALEKERRLPPEKQKPLLIVLFYVSTHYPYESQAQDQKFRPFLPDRFQSLVIHDGYREGLWNRYRNSCIFVDRQIGRVLQAAQPEISQGRLMWSFVGDHGEEFWDAGEYGHASRRLLSSRTQTAFALYAPMLKASKRVAVSSHADIFPTFLDLLGVDFPIEHYSDGASLIKPRTHNYVQINGYGFPDLPNFAIATPQRKIFARRTLGFELEVNAVLDSEDRPVRWTRQEIEPILRDWMKRVDHFYPNYRLWESSRVLYHPLPSFPFAPTYGPIRTAETPHLKPWERLGSTRDHVSTKPFPVKTPVGVRFGEYVEWVGYTFHKPEVRLGDDLVVEFVFRCRKKIPKGYKIFFHGHRERTPQFVGADHDPVYNTYPLYEWKEGEYIRDIMHMPTTNEWQPGSGRLHIGLYNKASGQRTPVYEIKTGQKLKTTHADVIAFWFVP